MYAWIQRDEHAPCFAEASPLLEHLAGEFAARIAALWPAPHAAYLTADAARRHLVCLALLAADDGGLARPANALLEMALGDAIDVFVPGAPVGLKRALARLGEAAWTPEDYRRLLAFLASPAAKTLRHAEQIEAEQVRGLTRLAEPLRLPSIAKLELSEDQVEVLCEIQSLVLSRHGAEAALAAAERWAAATTAQGLFKLAGQDLLREPPTPAFAGSAKLKLIHGKAAMRAAAARYKNCLVDQIRYAATGESLFYEWTGGAEAVVELWRDPVYGWRLNQARLTANKDVPAELQAEIIAELKTWGVHIGRASWQMIDAVKSACEDDFELQSLEATVADYFKA